MRFRKETKRPAYEQLLAQCGLIVRSLDAMPTRDGPDGWRITVSETPRRNVLPGENSVQAIERMTTARSELILELLPRPEPVGPTIQSGMVFADSLAAESRGVILDFYGQRVLMPGSWQVDDKQYDIDPREHVTIHVVAEPSGLWVHTHGLVKFGRPEFELFDLPPELERLAQAFLLDTSAYVIDGPVIGPGSTVGSVQAPLRGAEGTRERENHWDPVPVVEFRGEKVSTADALRAWAA
jgi:hypothetical protein